MSRGYDYDAPDSVHRLTFQNFPDFEPNFNTVILAVLAKPTDLISTAPIPRCGLLISGRFRSLLESFSLPPHRSFPVPLLHRKKPCGELLVAALASAQSADSRRGHCFGGRSAGGSRCWLERRWSTLPLPTPTPQLLFHQRFFAQGPRTGENQRNSVRNRQIVSMRTRLRIGRFGGRRAVVDADAPGAGVLSPKSRPGLRSLAATAAALSAESKRLLAGFSPSPFLISEGKHLERPGPALPQSGLVYQALRVTNGTQQGLPPLHSFQRCSGHILRLDAVHICRAALVHGLNDYLAAPSQKMQAAQVHSVVKRELVARAQVDRPVRKIEGGNVSQPITKAQDAGRLSSTIRFRCQKVARGRLSTRRAFR